MSKQLFFGVLICTRNRQETLFNLLTSLKNSRELPNQIVVVASGQDVEELIKKCSSGLPITYLYTKETGQSFQKNIGISLFDPNIDWVMLVDDDLILDKSTIKNAKATINSLHSNSVAGIGMRVSEPESRTKLRIRIKHLFKYRLGKISKFAIATHYMGSIKIKTEWLNGASIWKLSVLKQYELPFFHSKHAALEDVIFSSRVNENFELLYDPAIIVSQQIIPNFNSYSFDRFKYMTLWNAYFACINPRTSILLYKLVVLQRFLIFVLKGSHFDLKIVQSFTTLVYQVILFPNNKEICKIKVLNILQHEIDYDNK
jgi:glycosyltransferase involved in cell wall biosynthesis